jgi:hypothetical protein
MLEIGADGGASLAVWAKYFKNPSAIHGVSYGIKEDINQKKLVCSFLQNNGKESTNHCDVVRVFNGDQSDVTFLRESIVTQVQ